jgi:hypothetical protein
VLADKLECCTKTISSFENGGHRPHDRTLRDAVRVFAEAGVTILPPEERVCGSGVMLALALHTGTEKR